MFYIWIDDSQVYEQVENQSEFATENQRISGYQAGDIISSKVMNTAIRQANLVAVALMQALDVASTFNVKSAVTDLQAEIASKLSTFIGGPYVGQTNGQNKIYGTDNNGSQTTYDISSFEQVSDVQVNGISVVSNHIASIDLTGYYTKSQTDNLLSGKADDNAVVKLTGDQTIDGKKTFVKNLQIQDDLIIVNSDGDTLTDLSGVVVKTGYNDLLFKGIWNFKSLPTNISSFNATTNISANVKNNKAVVLYNMSVDNKRIIDYIYIEEFSMAINPTAQTNSGEFFTLSHNANEQVWTFNGVANLSSSDLQNYGIHINLSTPETISTSYSIDIFYLYSTSSFFISSISSIVSSYAFVQGSFEYNSQMYNFNQLFYGIGANQNFWCKNVEYDCGNDFTNAISVSTKSNYNYILEMFEPETNYQTQSVASAYCIVYDNSTDSVKIGYGYFDGDNFIAFSELSESIATREDSSPWTNGNFAKWNAVKNQFEDSGKSASDFATAGQGAKADTAVQPMEIDTLSTSPITLEDNKWFRLGTIATLTLNNPASISQDFVCMISFVADVNIAIDYSVLSITWSGDDVSSNTFVPVDGKTYDITFYNNSATSTASLQAIVRGV